MKSYKKLITLVRNNRGCYILDTIKGCSYTKNNKRGCYNNCYAANIANRYGFSFDNIIKRYFKNQENEQMFLFNFKDGIGERKIIKEINKINMPFIRIGEMGDPSEDWNHTINICKTISMSNKKIVIITKHWKILNVELLNEIKKMNICINTSISALDTNEEIKHRLEQYNILKKYCNSVLRIVSCDFNKKNYEGLKKSIIQENLFKNEKIIDTVFRPNINNLLIKNNIINIKKVKFLKSYVLASVYNDLNHFGYCANCKDMCGINL